MTSAKKLLIPFLSLTFSILLIIMYTCDLDYYSAHTSILFILFQKKTEYIVYAVMLIFHVSLFTLTYPKFKKWLQGITAMFLSLLFTVEVFFLNTYWMYLDVFAHWATDYYYEDFLKSSAKNIIVRGAWRYFALMGITILLCASWMLLHTKKGEQFLQKQGIMIRKFAGDILTEESGRNKALFFLPGTYVVGDGVILSAGRYLFELDLSRRKSGTVGWYREPDDEIFRIEYTYEMDENSPHCCISLMDGDLIVISGYMLAKRVTQDETFDIEK